jgi:threonine dehydrogenase-like Zn-dependent dehydrogenase
MKNLVSQPSRRSQLKGLVILGNSQAEVREVPRPEVKPGWVLVKMRVAGICGSDLHFYRDTPENLGARVGRVVGHEPAGVVEEVGPCVTAVRPGDRVSVYHWFGCGHCDACRAGYWQFCPDRRAIAASGYGSSAEYVLAPEAACLPLPGELSFAAGAMMACCAATAYSALTKLPAPGRSDVAVFGLGPVGLCTLIEAVAMGARVIGVDIVPERLELGRTLGADTVIDAGRADVVQAIREQTAGRGADAVVETSGSLQARAQVVDALALSGTGIYVGLGQEAAVVDPGALIEQEKVLRGSYVMPVAMYGAFTRFLVERDVRLERIVTHRFPIERGVEAIQLFDTRRTGKVVIEFE